MTSPVDPQAQLFDTCADAYAQHRPTYPAPAVEQILSAFALEPGNLVCDLGAGTGVLSFPLADRGINIIAVEPLEAMRKKGVEAAALRRLPVVFAGGVAEQIPLRDQSVNAVVCAQAFHWFKADLALSEIYRILKPDGGLALLWNNWDWQHIEWLADIERLITKYNPQHNPFYRTKDWAGIVNKGWRFSLALRFEFFHDRSVREPELLGLVDSFSYVRIIPAGERGEFHQELRALLRRQCERQSSETLRLRYQTELYLARKLSDHERR